MKIRLEQWEQYYCRTSLRFQKYISVSTDEVGRIVHSLEHNKPQNSSDNIGRSHVIG